MRLQGGQAEYRKCDPIGAESQTCLIPGVSGAFSHNHVVEQWKVECERNGSWGI